MVLYGLVSHAALPRLTPSQEQQTYGEAHPAQAAANAVFPGGLRVQQYMAPAAHAQPAQAAVHQAAVHQAIPVQVI